MWFSTFFIKFLLSKQLNQQHFLREKQRNEWGKTQLKIAVGF